MNVKGETVTLLLVKKQGADAGHAPELPYQILRRPEGTSTSMTVGFRLASVDAKEIDDPQTVFTADAFLISNIILLLASLMF